MNPHNLLHNIEHTLNIYATGALYFQARELYNDQFLSEIISSEKSYHIYMIGYLPQVNIKNVHQRGSDLVFTLSHGQKIFNITYPLPHGFNLVKQDNGLYAANSEGNVIILNKDSILLRIHQEEFPLHFDVKYIGQSYGNEGSRSAIDRLVKHETLQKISLMGAPENHQLYILLFEIIADTRVILTINPHAQNEDDGTRLKAGIDKLFGTTEHERISIYEAAMIRYFSPEYNIEFKNSFPSTNLKILQDCYDKDFAAVAAEISIDDLPFLLFSKFRPAKPDHIAHFNLHKEEDRRGFFFGKSPLI